jgi:peroxiredoxin
VVRGALTPATIALLLASTTLNVVQAKRLGMFAGAAVAQPELGTVAQVISAKTLEGRPVEIALQETPTILYYFSPTCGWCERNWLNVKALIAGTEGKYRFIGLSTSRDIKAFMDNHELAFEVYSDLSPETTKAYHFLGTPHTVVVGADGRVQQSWIGAYNGNQQRVVEHALDLILPGIPKPEVNQY